MGTHSFQAPKGTRDFYPADLAVRRHIEAAWRSASVDCGFDEVDGPTFEHLELYTAKSGEGIVNELFSFRRAGGESDYALRPEFTPTVARMIAAHAGSLPIPVKWFAIPSMFRAERPQRGRLREFFQWNIDTVGAEGAPHDLDVIACGILALERLGLTPRDVQVRISHRAAIARMLAALGVPADKTADAMTLLDRRDKLKPEDFAQRAGALGLSADGIARFDIAARATQSLEAPLADLAAKIGIPAEEFAALDELRAHAARLGILEWCSVDIGIVRGLAYYTGTVFEVHEMLPAAGQGALGIEVREDAVALRETLSHLVHAPTFLAAHAERAVSRALGGSCSMPLAAHAVWEGTHLRLRAALGDGMQPHRPLLEVELRGQPADEPQARALGEQAVVQLRAAGADAYLQAA